MYKKSNVFPIKIRIVTEEVAITKNQSYKF